MSDSRLNIPFFVLSATALAVGCKATADKPTNGIPHDSAAAIQLDKAKAATAAAAQAVEDYAYARKAEFVAKMRREMLATQEELDRLAAKAERASGTAKADAQTKLAAAREKWTKTKQQLDQAERATESTWEDVKSDVKASYGGLKSSVDDTRRWLSDKIAP
jgi:uncharacterized protein YicC (UPF0701 family)